MASVAEDGGTTTPAPLSEAEVDAFVQQHGLEVHRKRRARLLKMSVDAWQTYKLSTVVAASCKRMDLHRALDAYALFRKTHFSPVHSTTTTSSSSGGSSGGSSSGAPQCAQLQHGPALMGASRPPLSLYTTLLSLVAGLGDQGSGSGPVREGEPPHDIGT